MTEERFNELSAILPIHSEGEKQVVNARDLHEVLGIQTRFNDWIGEALRRSYLTENEDYTIVNIDAYGNVIPEGDTDKFVRKREYAITVDASKHLALMCANRKGKEVRDYFIQAEKMKRQYELEEARNTPTLSMDSIEYELIKNMPYDPGDKIGAMEAYILLYKEKNAIERKLDKTSKELARRAEHTTMFYNFATKIADNEINIDDAAKEMTAYGIKIGPNKFKDYLAEVKFLVRHTRKLSLSQAAISKGYALYHKSWERCFGAVYNVQRIYITSKGFENIVKAIHGNCREIFLKYGSFYTKEEVEELTNPFI